MYSTGPRPIFSILGLLSPTKYTSKLALISPDTGQLLEESAVLQVVLDDDIGHCVKDKLHVLGVGGACEVSVDLLGIFPLIQIFKLTLNVGSGLFICI